MSPHLDFLIVAAALGVIAAILAQFLPDLWSFPADEIREKLLLGLVLFWSVASIRLVFAGGRDHLRHA